MPIQRDLLHSEEVFMRLDGDTEFLKDAQVRLQDAVNAAFTPHPANYKHVTVLLMHFNNDDIGVIGLEKELAKTFADFYGYNIRRLELDGSPLGSKPSLATQIFKVFMELEPMTGKSSLLIVVYSGHAALAIKGDSLSVGSPHIGGAVDQKGCLKGRTVNWYLVKEFMTGLECDVVQIMDCCHAAEASHYKFETLAATSGTEIAAGNLERCFTRGLIEELKRNSSAGTTVSRLAAQLMHHRKVLQFDYTPFYSPKNTSGPSVRLEPRKHIEVPKNVPILATDTGNYRAILQVHLGQTLREQDLEDLKIWMTKLLPANVKGVKITLEHYFQADSSYLLIGVPIEVWLHMKPHPAWQFNFRAQAIPESLQEQQSRSLALRPAANENIRPSGPSK